MSTTYKAVLSLVVLAIVVALGYYGYQWYQVKQSAAMFSDAPAELPTGTSTTDDSLAKDAAAIDLELKGLDADATSANASLEESATVQ
jgi:uncharacterized membrane protein YebE (DUF533 family)